MSKAWRSAALWALFACALHAAASLHAAARGQIRYAELPREAQDVLAAIRHGGPFPYRKDGAVFFNRERLLPVRPQGTYREFTVPSPGLAGRGARRIIAAWPAPDPMPEARAGRSVSMELPEFVARREFYYTDDHYRSFRRIIP